MSKERLNLTLDDGYKKKLRKIADKQNRSMAGQIQHWIDNTNIEIKNDTKY
jgi:hypothetical protein